MYNLEIQPLSVQFSLGFLVFLRRQQVTQVNKSNQRGLRAAVVQGKRREEERGPDLHGHAYRPTSLALILLVLLLLADPSPSSPFLCTWN